MSTQHNILKQNSHTEVGITTLLLRRKVIMIGVGINFERRYTLFREAIETATHFDALIPIELNDAIKTRVEH